jgi:DNA-binding FadR family transcriptional regulator
MTSTERSTLPEPKAAEIIASRVEREIAAAGWPVGEVVGSELELIERYGVSRAVLREAIRILEHHFVVRTRRGRGGGLIVTEPDSSTVARSMKLFLQYRRTNAEQIHEARMLAELACVELAAHRIDDDGRAELKRVLDLEGDTLEELSTRSMHDFHVTVGRLSGNPVLELNVQSMAALVQEWYGEGEDERPEDALAAHKAHKSIAQAIRNGDVEAAVRRMSRHLDALAPYVESRAHRT